MVIDSLTRATIDRFVDGPGVALVGWRDPKSALGVLFDDAYRAAARAHRDVQFGSVDVARDPALARAWNAETTPTLMVYRDGILLFSRTGLLPEPVLEGLVQAVFCLDMAEVRQGLDSSGGRVFLWLRADRTPPFQIDGDEADDAETAPGSVVRPSTTSWS